MLPRALVIGGLLAAGLIGAALGTPRGASTGATAAADTQASFAFGFLEFDRHANARGGVPGFDSRPDRKLRIAEARAQPDTHGITK